MTKLNFIIAIVALIIATLAYRRAGGISDLRNQVESMGSLREKTADLLSKLEKRLRKEEAEEKPEEKLEEKKEESTG